ncbi:MAG: hypothetical protein HY908_28620 [Myxococcales bacterium]|nr:hypothetical protein [Myxococcales bacterium]
MDARRASSLRSLAAACALAGALGCGRGPAPDAAASSSAPAESSSARVASEGDVLAESAACAARRAALESGPREPGAPELEAHRVELVGRVRGATAWWRREPAASAAGAADSKGASAAKAKAKSRAHDAVRALMRRHKKSPEALRAAVLREGYLFASRVDEALALVDQVSLAALFAEPQVFLLRRGVVHLLRRVRRDARGPERYVHAEGPMAGEPAELLFGDRVGLDPGALGQGTLAVDLGAAQAELGFEALREPKWVGDVLAAEARYGAEWVPTLFDASGTIARTLCQAPSTAQAPLVAAAREATRRAAPVRARIRDVVEEEVREALPFDAPRGDSGGGDERFPLRPRWDSAYAAGLRTYRYGERRYDVYDAVGRPLRPQVCIEFVYDTWERAAGSWFAPMAARTPGGALEPAPQRLVGTFQLPDLGFTTPRHFQSFVDFSASHPEAFEVWVVPPEERVAYTKPEAFFALLGRNAAQFRTGDVLVFRRAKWDGHSMYHAVLVMETDPFSGVPSLVAGNAARPRLQTMQGVMQVTWRRYLDRRVRPRPEWLDTAIRRHLGLP